MTTLIMIGDWNARARSKEDSKSVVRFGRGTRNEAGERLIEYCEANNLLIANPFFVYKQKEEYTHRHRQMANTKIK